MTKINKKVVWAVVCLFVVVLIIPLLINQIKSSTINIYVVPSSAEILLNNKKYQNGTFSLFPGEYEVVINAEGFENKTMKVNVEANHSVNLFTALNTESDYYEKNANSDDYGILKEVSKYDDDAKNILEDIQNAEKIYEDLPKAFKTSSKYYAIEKSEDCQKILCLKIRNFNGNNYDEAVNEIRKMGYAPERYDILNVDSTGANL